jgi:hypothetical protein
MADKIEAELRSELANTPYTPASLNALSGGTANFIFRATPHEETFPDGRTEVIVKHGEAFVASMPDFALTTSRCVSDDFGEAQLLRAASVQRWLNLSLDRISNSSVCGTL